MGLFDIFKSRPSKKNILAQVQKAKEVYAQPEYRRAAMDKLLKWGTDEAIAGLLERFSVVVQSPHWDEDEKRWLVEELIKMGDRALPILRGFIIKKNEINHALLAYRNIADDSAYGELLVEALRARPPSDHRSSQGKQELIAAMGELYDESLDDLLLPYLGDHSDDVQCAAIDILSKGESDVVRRRLVELLSSDAHSARVLRTAANAVCKLDLALGENPRLSDIVLEDFRVEKGRLIRLRRGA